MSSCGEPIARSSQPSPSKSPVVGLVEKRGELRLVPQLVVGGRRSEPGAVEDHHVADVREAAAVGGVGVGHADGQVGEAVAVEVSRRERGGEPRIRLKRRAQARRALVPELRAGGTELRRRRRGGGEGRRQGESGQKELL
jgi:hypothetical protein